MAGFLGRLAACAAHKLRSGFTTLGTDIETAAYRAICTKINTSAQTQATMARQSSKLKPKFDFEPLTGPMWDG